MSTDSDDEYFRISVGIDSSSCVVESAAAFLFNLFKDADRVRQVEALSLREMFGPYPMSQADRACQAVGRLVSTLADEVGSFPFTFISYC